MPRWSSFAAVAYWLKSWGATRQLLPFPKLKMTQGLVISEQGKADEAGEREKAFSATSLDLLHPIYDNLIEGYSWLAIS
jgi:hypothetical protein